MSDPNDCLGKFEIRQDITTIPADDPHPMKLDWKICEEEATNNNTHDYSNKAYETDEADKYRGRDTKSVIKEHLNRRIFTSHKILSELNGRPWNNLALSAILMFEPSGIRVVDYNGSVTLDCVPKRITVFLQEDNRTISRIEMELSPCGIGVKTGEDFCYKMNGISLPPSKR